MDIRSESRLNSFSTAGPNEKIKRGGAEGRTGLET